MGGFSISEFSSLRGSGSAFSAALSPTGDEILYQIVRRNVVLHFLFEQPCTAPAHGAVAVITNKSTECNLEIETPCYI